MVGFNRRFAPMAAALKTFLADVSEPLFVHYRVNAGFIPREHWIQDSAVGGGRLIGEAVHFIDFVNWLAGATPAAVDAVRAPRQRPLRERQLHDQPAVPERLRCADRVRRQRAIVPSARSASRSTPGGGARLLEDFRSLRLMGRRTESSRTWLGADKGPRGRVPGLHGRRTKRRPFTIPSKRLPR
jgi:predicted dehydrogenase